MKTQNSKSGVFVQLACSINLLSTGIMVMCCLLTKQSFSQTHMALLQAIGATEKKAEILSAQAAIEKNILKGAEENIDKTKTLRDYYLNAVDDYIKTGLNPYNEDLKNYTDDLTKYKDAVTRHADEVKQSNDTDPEQRSPATVARLNGEIPGLQSWGERIDAWKGNLDASKAKLDARLTVLRQQHQFEIAYQTAIANFEAARRKLNDILDQLIICEKYSQQAKKMLENKYHDNYDGKKMRGIFGSSLYKIQKEELTGILERAKQKSDVFDGRKESD